jgi:hypothetical protein
MGIFDFLKKALREPEKKGIIREKISFINIEEFIKEKSNSIKTKENDVISLINERINFFTNELREKIEIIEEVDFESKEKNDKIKSVVHEGRKKYIEFLERFMKNIKITNKIPLEKVVWNINLAFTQFGESSAKSYERATILIGKEMGSVKETLKRFSTELLEIFNENKDIISLSKRLSLIELKVNEIKEIKLKSIEIEEEIINLTNKIREKGKESKEISENIEKIKESVEYIENIEREKSLHIKEKDIEQAMYNLKQLIDFKALSNFFHIFKDKMEIVKLYRENFTEEFRKDNGDSLLNLLNESKLNTENIYYAIKQIQDKKQDIEKSKKEIKKDKTQYLSSEFERINQEAQGFMNEIGWAEKKNDKLKVAQDEALKIIKEELNLVGVDLSN